MKTFIIIILTMCAQTTFAQCDKSFLLNFSEITEIRGKTISPIKHGGNISFSKEQIIIKILINGEEKLINSEIVSADCQWETFLKNGTTVYKLLSGKGTDEPQDQATLTLEGKNGALKVTFRPPGAQLQFLITQTNIAQ